MELIEAQEKDLDTLVQIWTSLAEEMEQYSKFNELKEDIGEISKQGFRKHLQEEKYTEYLIKNKEVLGLLTLKQGKNPSRKHEDYTKIVNLYIKQDFRGKGLGTEVIEKVKELAKDRGSDVLKVTSEIENTGAIDFYRENGFEEKQVNMVQSLEDE
jgi:ribosomal protein S18 acetylase RimI-like enzyme